MQKEKKYEICFILGENHTEDKAKEISKEVVRIIEKRGGKLEREFFWGKRKLAYPIKRNSFGYYFIFVFVADPVMVNKMTKDLSLDEHILRYLTTDYLENTAFWEENGGEKRERKEGERIPAVLRKREKRIAGEKKEVKKKEEIAPVEVVEEEKDLASKPEEVKRAGEEAEEIKEVKQEKPKAAEVIKRKEGLGEWLL